MAVYAAQVMEMDRAVGQIMEAVQDTGEEEDTVFLFLSDNGACAEELPPDGWVMNFAEGMTLACGCGKPDEETPRRRGYIHQLRPSLGQCEQYAIPPVQALDP